MWLFTDIGFFSVVQHKDENDQVVVRSWVRKDLEALREHYLPELGQILEAEGTYRYRANAPAEAFAAATTRIAEAINYDNFEKAVDLGQGRGRAALYGGIWEMARRLEKEDDAHRHTLRQGAVIESPDGRLLLRKPPGEADGYAWTFAKGERQLGESPEDAAIRIARTRCGAASTEVLDRIPGTFRGSWTETSYLVLRAASENSLETTEAEAIQWATADQARRLLSESSNGEGRARDLAVLDAWLQWRSRSAPPEPAPSSSRVPREVLASFVRSLELGEPLHHLNLTVFPLIAPNGSRSPYQLLGEAVESGVTEVKEVSGGASVPTLSVVNRGDQPVLIVDGEILEGAMQNRMANVSVIVEAHSNWTLPVSCVEEGRWNSVSEQFRSTRHAPAGLRARNTRAVHEGRVARGGTSGRPAHEGERGRGDQGAVWEDVRRRLDRLGAHSPTASLADGYQQAEDRLDAYRKHLSPPPHSRGLLVAQGDRVLGMDLFDCPATLETLSRRLTDGYFMEALNDPAPRPPAGTATATAFLDRIAEGILAGEGDAAGAGTEIEVVHDDAVGQGVWFGDRVCHLAAFAIEKPSPYARHLEVAVQAAREASAIFQCDFFRTDGPRGQHDKAPADSEAEDLIRTRLEHAFPDHGIIGEELGRRNRASRDEAKHLWLIDPNDGTSAYLGGARGPSVSIGLLRGGEPVLGVVLVHGDLKGDEDGDLFAWAEGSGCPVRNGRPVPRQGWADELTGDHTVFVSHHADKASKKNAESVAPARFRTMPSIATRLALVAAGDGEVGISLGGPGALDITAGHALLRGAGGELYFEGGHKVTYDADGNCGYGNFFGGSPSIARKLAKRGDWASLRNAGRHRPRQAEARPTDMNLNLLRARPGQAVADRARLLRATGCLMGQLAGDALGSLVEFKDAGSILLAYPDGVRRLADGGTWNTIAGQPTDDSELALILARTLVAEKGFDSEAVASGYARWHASSPFDMGNTTSQALSAAQAALEQGEPVAKAAAAAAKTGSKANGALMRISPLGIFCSASAPESLAGHARDDSRLTHPNQVCQDASVAFARAIALLVSGRACQQDVLDAVLGEAGSLGLGSAVRTALEKARREPPHDYQHQMGYVVIALQNAFYQLLHAPSLEEGIIDTVGRGGDTDTNAAIAGALLGAAHGLHAVPAQWLDRVLTCRPIQGLPGVKKPRPKAFWPVDALVLAEQLLYVGVAG